MVQESSEKKEDRKETPEEKSTRQKLQREKRRLASDRKKVNKKVSQKEIREMLRDLKILHTDATMNDTRNKYHDHVPPPYVARPSSPVHQQERALTIAASVDNNWKNTPSTTVVKKGGMKKGREKKRTTYCGYLVLYSFAFGTFFGAAIGCGNFLWLFGLLVDIATILLFHFLSFCGLI
jgi:hypothetical protein